MHSLSSRLTALSAIAVAAKTPPLAPASADPAEETIVEEILVSSRGQDLTSSVGQTVLRSRIEHAARRVCGAYDRPMHWFSNAYLACHDKAVAEAIVHAQALSARADPHDPKMVAEARSVVF